MGMRQRLGVAACLIGDPQLLILDEPMNGLDPAGMQDMREIILSLVAEGRTVVLSSHLLDEVERTCDAVAIVDRGSVVRQGPIAELLGGRLARSSRSNAPTPIEPVLIAHAVGTPTDRRRCPRARHHFARAETGTRRDRRDQPCLVEGGTSVYRLQSDPGIARIVVPPRSQADWGRIAVTTVVRRPPLKPGPATGRDASRWG